MSVLTHRSVSCHGCGKQAVHRVARSLNAERSPELVRAILSEGFQRFACASCKSSYVVEDPFVFIDFPAKLWIGHFPRAWEVDWRKLERHAEDSFRHAMLEHAPEMVRRMTEGFRVRTVFGLAALREKLLCFGARIDSPNVALQASCTSAIADDDPIDDGMLEVLKLDILRATPGLSFSLSARPRLLRVTADELILCAAAPAPGLLLHVPRSRLAKLAAQAPAWDALLGELSAGPYVDLGRLLLP